MAEKVFKVFTNKKNNQISLILSRKKLNIPKDKNPKEIKIKDIKIIF